MHPLGLINVVTSVTEDSANNPSQFLTPYLPLIGIVAGAIIVGVFNAHNRQKGNVETRAPNVNEMWQQERLLSKELDAERKFRRRLEDHIWHLLNAFKNYVDRVRQGGSLELTPHEHKLYSEGPPTAPQPSQKE